MGKKFPLIADNSLKAIDADDLTCQVCNTTNIPLYNCHGRLIVDEPQQNEMSESKTGLLAKLLNLFNFPQKDTTPIPDFDIYEVCEECLKKGNIEDINEGETDKVIEIYCSDIIKSKELLRRTPRIPLFLQYGDWPVHCGELCEFIGNPKNYKESIEISETLLMWDRGHLGYYEPYNEEESLKPEALNEVSIFRCRKCNEKVFTWQFT